jgi:DNA-binding HxlR family transcriptional regulator
VTPLSDSRAEPGTWRLASRSESAGPGRSRGGCPVGELLALLGQPHTLEILHAFGSAQGRAMRFGELERTLHLAPKTLSQRLRALVEKGFLVRHAYNEIPPRVEYEPTRKVSELTTVFRALDKWARSNTLTAIPVVSTVGRLPR